MQQKGPLSEKLKVKNWRETAKDFGLYALGFIAVGILFVLSPVIVVSAIVAITLGVLGRGIRNVYRNRVNRTSEALEMEALKGNLAEKTHQNKAGVSAKPSPLAQNDQLIPDVKPEPIKVNEWPEPSMEDLQKIGPEKFGTLEQSKEEKLELFKAACLEVKADYPPEMIEAFGLYDLAALPVLDMKAFQSTLEPSKREDPVRYLTSDSLEGNKVMRGIIPGTNPKQPVIFCHTDDHMNKGKGVLAIFQSMDYPSACAAIGTKGIELMSGQTTAMTSPKVQELFSAVKEVMDGKKGALAHRELNATLNDLSSKAPEDKMPKMR